MLDFTESTTIVNTFDFCDDVPTAELDTVLIALTKSLNALIYGGEELERMNVNL